VNRGVLDVRRATAVEPIAALAGIAGLSPNLWPALLAADVARRDQDFWLNEAIVELQQAIRMQPEAFPAYVTLAHAYQKQGKWTEAFGQLDEAIRRAPNVPALYRERAQLHALRGDMAAALQDYDRVIDLQRERPTAALAVDLAEQGRLLFLAGKFEAAAL